MIKFDPNSPPAISKRIAYSNYFYLVLVCTRLDPVAAMCMKSRMSEKPTYPFYLHLQQQLFGYSFDWVSSQNQFNEWPSIHWNST